MPITLTIANGDFVDYANSTITFDYMMAEQMLLPDKTKTPKYCDGEIRIWTRDGGQVRMMWNLKDGGQLVETGVGFTLKELGFVNESGNLVTNTVTLYVEGMSNSSQLAESINVRADYHYLGGSVAEVEDSVRYTVISDDAFDLAIDSDNDGVISCSPFEDQMEEDAPGKLIPISPTSAVEHRVEMIFKWSEAKYLDKYLAAVQFNFPAHYKLFTAKNNGTEIVSGQVYNFYDLPELEANGIMMLYVGATSSDAGVKDIIEVVAYPDGTEPNPVVITLRDKIAVSTTQNANDLPDVGIIGDIHAIEGTNDTISFNIMRKGDLSKDITVRFKIDWAYGLTLSDFKNLTQPIRLEELLVPGTTDTFEITIPKGKALSETIILRAYEDDGQVPGELFVETSMLTILPDPMGTQYNVASPGEEVDKKDYRMMRDAMQLAVIEKVTLFGDKNTSSLLVDPVNSSGVNSNDVAQGTLGDCYFMAALKALAARHPAWILGQITGTPFTSDYTVKMYNQDGTRYQDILFDKNSNLLSNGLEMARLTYDYLEWTENGNTLDAIEIWSQLYEKAWVQMNGGYYQNISSGNTEVAWKALTGKDGIGTSCAGKTHDEILQIINDATAAGKIVCLETKLREPATTTADIWGLASGIHAYYLTGSSINDYTMINPWGMKPRDHDNNQNTPDILAFQDVPFYKLINKTNGNVDLSQYIGRVCILDPIY